MRKLLMGTVAAVTLLAAPQAMAQVGFYVGPGGAGIEFGDGYGYYGYDAARTYVPRARGYRWGRHDSYNRWRKEGFPNFETER
jgi:hypothetical protein